ncbi:Ovule protein [Caenorhabditis elegans]|uniref:Ovule protein n=1 Tax=Caenorhabditis elegans TaxID=6239 RepID=Q20125_CAEEL|nr:Ovule protein [Caenorhabditis elegans]CCD70743.2 Ovule protein [Caenorhabditis elegans]|eukprot:NP_498577.2 Uncharacterized protein CELE_F37C12.14 [Caenorhabditis elegans]
MTTPLPNFYYFAPLNGIWCPPPTSIYTFFSISSPVIMYSQVQNQMWKFSIPNLNTFYSNIIQLTEDQPMHLLEPEKPMEIEVENSSHLDFKRENSEYDFKVEKADYSDMPQLTRMDC